MGLVEKIVADRLESISNLSAADIRRLIPNDLLEKVLSDLEPKLSDAQAMVAIKVFAKGANRRWPKVEGNSV